jgi:SAM-dependent methyltransferase
MMHEHLVRYLFAGQLVAGKAVLDVGCGVGYGAQKLALSGAASVKAFDISPDAVAHAVQFYAHPAVCFEVADAEKFSLDAKFDVVTCFEMIEHVQYPDRVLQCIKRHLKPDGIVLASTPRFLGEKRTHFHVREYSLEDYQALVEKFFPNTVMYLENNHFSSLITAMPASRIERVAYLKDQFTSAQADVFISVSCGPKAEQPEMQASVVFDDDNYVVMLERDVAILHKAEDDIRASLEVERADAREVAAFKDAEIARLVSEYNALFERAAAGEGKFDQDRRAFHDERMKWQNERDKIDHAREVDRWKWQLELDRLGHAKEMDSEAFAMARSEFELAQAQHLAEIDHLKHEEIRFDQDRRAFHDERMKWQNERDQIDHAKEVELRTVRERHEQELALLRQAETDLIAKLNENRDTRDREIARLAEQVAELARVAAVDSEAFAMARSEFELAQAQHLTEINRLTHEGAALRMEGVRHLALLRETEMTLADLNQQQQALQGSVESLQARLGDADARRLEAFEFARVASDQAHALRREIDILKRDLVEALDFPDAVSATATATATADPRHRDIVEAMERLFLGTEATHAVARNPLIVRVAALAVANRTLAANIVQLSAEAYEQRARAERAEAFAEDLHAQILTLSDDIGQQHFEVHEQRARAERAEAFAEDWHAQILTLRRSASWRFTKPLRGLGRLFR